MNEKNMTMHKNTLSSEEVLHRMQEILREILDLESAESISPDANLQDDLHIDSLGMVDVVIGVEEAFGIKIRSDFNLFQNLVTVADTVDLVMKLTSNEE
jgi:acyl carrier protein